MIDIVISKLLFDYFLMDSLEIHQNLDTRENI